MKSDAVCGTCARAAREQELDDEIVALRNSLASPDVDDWTAEPPEEVTAAVLKRDQELFLLTRRYPTAEFKKTTRPEKDPAAIRSAGRKSILSTEVMPEDVVVKYEVNPYAMSASWDDWNEGYTRLEDELDEVATNQAAQDATGITVSWAPWAGQGEHEHEELEQFELSTTHANAMNDQDSCKSHGANGSDKDPAHASGPNAEELCTEPDPVPRAHETDRPTLSTIQNASTELQGVAKENSKPVKALQGRYAVSKPLETYKSTLTPATNEEPLSTRENEDEQAFVQALPWHGYRSLGHQLLVSL